MDSKDYATIAISVIALLVAFYGVVERRYAAKQAARLRVSTLCDELTKLGIEQEDEIAAQSAAASGHAFQALRNARREVLCSTADELVGRFSIRLSVGEYKTLALGLRACGDWERALSYWLRAVRASTPNTVECVLALRGAAAFLMHLGRYAEAQQYFERAAATCVGEREDQVTARAETYAAWAIHLREAGLTGFEDARDRAFAETSKIDNRQARRLVQQRLQRRLGAAENTTLLDTEDGP